MIEPSVIFSVLSSATVVTNLVQQKIFPGTVPQTTNFPYIIYEMVSEVPERCRSGISIEEARVQLTVYSKSFKGAQQLYAAVRSTLDGATMDGIQIQWLNTSPLYREEGDAHGKAIDFQLIK